MVAGYGTNKGLVKKIAEIYDGLDAQIRENNQCPYNIEGKCTVYEYRFTACRIFCCSADADFQSELSETVLKKLKSLCEEFQIPYCYNDLAFALNAFVDG